MIFILLVAGLLQIALLTWLGLWAIPLIALGIAVIPALAWWERQPPAWMSPGHHRPYLTLDRH